MIDLSGEPFIAGRLPLYRWPGFGGDPFQAFLGHGFHFLALKFAYDVLGNIGALIARFHNGLKGLVRYIQVFVAAAGFGQYDKQFFGLWSITEGRQKGIFWHGNVLMIIGFVSHNSVLMMK
jgi:hypothetical protein